MNDKMSGATHLTGQAAVDYVCSLETTEAGHLADALQNAVASGLDPSVLALVLAREFGVSPLTTITMNAYLHLYGGNE